jgi:hypothetical protein
MPYVKILTGTVMELHLSDYHTTNVDSYRDLSSTGSHTTKDYMNEAPVPQTHAHYAISKQRTRVITSPARPTSRPITNYTRN